MDLSAISALDLAGAIRDRKISSVEATEAALERLAPVHAACNAAISIEADEVLAAAKAADEKLTMGAPSGPLHGVPLAHKDMFDRQGKIPSWGARIRRDEPCAADGTVIARLKGAG